MPAVIVLLMMMDTCPAEVEIILWGIQNVGRKSKPNSRIITGMQPIYH